MRRLAMLATLLAPTVVYAADVVPLYDVTGDQVASAVMMSDGVALTCYHVLDHELPNRVIARDEINDLALIAVDATGGSILGSPPDQGDEIVMSAYFDGTHVRLGGAIASAERGWVDEIVLEGMSGGALEDAAGNLVGVLAGVDGWDDEWIGAYVPIELIAEFIEGR